MKKLFSVFLALICLLAIIGCKSKDYELKVEVIESVYVGEKSNYVVKVMPDNITLDDYEYSSSDESIFKAYNGKVEGIKEGKANLIITKTYEKQNLQIEIEISVSKKKVDYELEVTYTEEIEVGETIAIKVQEKQTETAITDFNLFTENTDIASYDNNIITGLKAGSAKFKVSCNFEGETLVKEFVIAVKAASVVMITNVPNNMYENQEVEVVITSPSGEVINDYNLTIDDEDLLLFDESGKKLFAFSQGEVTITISGEYNNQKWELKQQITILEGFSMEVKGESSIYVGDETSFKVYINPGMIEITDYNVTITNKNIAQYENNKITGLKTGQTKVIFSYVYCDVNVSTYIDLEVNRIINKYIAINIPNYMFINEVKKLEIALKPYNEMLENINVTIEDESVLNYSDGNLKALKEGKTNITISGTNQDKNYSEVFLVDVCSFTGLELALPEEMYVNEVIEYQVKALPSEIKMTNAAIKVSQNAQANEKHIFSTEEGICNVTVSYSYNGMLYEDSKNIMVKKIVHDVERIYLTGSSGVLKGSQNKLEISTYPVITDYKVLFESSDTDVATVDAEGNVTGKACGKSVITAYLENNPEIKSIINITVIDNKETSVVAGTNGKGEYCGRYYESSIMNYYELMYGVTETTYYGYTSTLTAGIDVDGYTGLDEIIEVNKYYPQSVHVLEVPSSKNIKVIPYANLNGNVWTLTTVKGFIQDYEKTHPNQKVICAINGDFFDINAKGNLPYQTTGENISDGEYYKTTNSHGSTGGTLGFTNDGSNVSIVGNGKAERTENMILAIYNDQNEIIMEFEVENLNTLPELGETSVYFGIYNENKEYVPVTIPQDKKMYVVEKAELALPNSSDDFYGLGTITSTSIETLNKGSFAIVSENEEVNKALEVGMRIRIQYEYTGEYANVTSATGYNNLIYNDINLLPDSYIADRAPRTVVGMKADGTIVMMVVDGRQGASDMYGADGTELAAIMNAYGCICAYNLDGGGSSTIVVRDESGIVVLNSPSDGKERTDGNCILVVCENPNYDVKVENLTNTKVTLNVSTSDEEYKQYTPYIRLNNSFYEVIDGKVSIDDLVHNTQYNYVVYYKDGDTLLETATIGSFTTKKSGFKFLGVTVHEEENEYIIQVYYDDIDSSSNIKSMSINFNGIETYLDKDKLSIKKSIVGDYIENFEYSYWYEESGETITIKSSNYFLW